MTSLLFPIATAAALVARQLDPKTTPVTRVKILELNCDGTKLTGSRIR